MLVLTTRGCRNIGDDPKESARYKYEPNYDALDNRRMRLAQQFLDVPLLETRERTPFANPIPKRDGSVVMCRNSRDG